jgi:hypothetical protein
MTTGPVRVRRATNGVHKFMAQFPDGGAIVRFGRKGYSDFTIHKDPMRMKRYLTRHRSRENWTRSGARTAGFWSRWLLWSEPNFQAALRRTQKILGRKIVYTK